MVEECGAQLRQAITDAALELGRDGGETGLTMRAIAKRLGVSATALYQHFDSKSEIIEQIWLSGLEQLAQTIEAPLRIEPCQDALIEMGLAYIRFARDNPWVYQVIMGKRPGTDAEFSAADAAKSQRSFRMVIQAIERGIERGEVAPSVQPMRAALHNWASLHGMAAQILTGRFSQRDPSISTSLVPASNGVHGHPAGEDFVLHFIKNLAYTTTERCAPWFMHVTDD